MKRGSLFTLSLVLLSISLAAASNITLTNFTNNQPNITTDFNFTNWTEKPNITTNWTDRDGDGIVDISDKCPHTQTPLGFQIDQNGCSAEQFCGLQEIETGVPPRSMRRTDKTEYYRQFRNLLKERKNCFKVDWKNNENKRYPGDCKPKINKQFLAYSCVANPRAN